MKPSAKVVVRKALELLARVPPIAYTQMDCQGFVKACVNQSGGSMVFAGSNDMFRNACEWIGTVDEARASGRLAPGALLFLLEHNGKEPERYKADGIGNASHVGLYTAAQQAEVVHSSKGKGCVNATGLANGWTHMGLAKAIEYAVSDGEAVQPAPHLRVTVAVPQGEHLRMRETPSASGAYMQRIPSGTALVVIARQNGFAQAGYAGHTGWVDERFLAYADGGEAPPEPEKPVAEAEMVAAPRALLRRWLMEIADVLEDAYEQ